MLNTTLLFRYLKIYLSTSTYKIYPANADPISLQLSVLRRSDDELCSVWVNMQIGQLPAVNSYVLIEKSLRGWPKGTVMGRETNDARERRTCARR